MPSSFTPRSGTRPFGPPFAEPGSQPAYTMRPSGSTTGSTSFDRLKVMRRSAVPSVLTVQRLVFGATRASFRSPSFSPTNATWTHGSTLFVVIV